MADAEVIELAVRRCSDCEHLLSGPSGTLCRLYEVPDVEDHEARECEGYDPVPWARREKA